MPDGDPGRSPASLDLAIAWLGRRIADLAAVGAGRVARRGRRRDPDRCAARGRGAPGPRRTPGRTPPCRHVPATPRPPGRARAARRPVRGRRRRATDVGPRGGVGRPRAAAGGERGPGAAHGGERGRAVGHDADGRDVARPRSCLGAAARCPQRRAADRPVAAAGAAGRPRAAPDGTRATPLLDEIGRDLTALARDGMLAPSIGRDTETARLIEALVRPTRPSAVLLGPEGIGKASIVEGLAMRVVAGEVPAPLKDVRIVEVPISALVAGTQYRGQLEERLVAARPGGLAAVADPVHRGRGPARACRPDRGRHGRARGAPRAARPRRGPARRHRRGRGVPRRVGDVGARPAADADRRRGARPRGHPAGPRRAPRPAREDERRHRHGRRARRPAAVRRGPDPEPPLPGQGRRPAVRGDRRRHRRRPRDRRGGGRRRRHRGMVAARVRDPDARPAGPGPGRRWPRPASSAPSSGANARSAR